MRENETKKTRKYDARFIQNICFSIFLIIYPMRHVASGTDLWDTGYNYANFVNAGIDHMDPMWFFSTYFSNIVGHFLTMLPFGNTLIGLNVYTGLCASILALMGYWFCTQTLRIPGVIALLGEAMALSLCWCPTALLYNYLTYIFFLAGVIFLYKGLLSKNKKKLILAGVCLGINLFVRLSNFAETGMIVAVWAFSFIEYLEEKKNIKLKKMSVEKKENHFKNAAWNTLWCLIGYLVVVIVVLGWISVKYGFGFYSESVMRLFAMTETATDYKATSMVMAIVNVYKDSLYYVFRILFFVVLGMLIHGVVTFILFKLKKLNEKNEKNLELFTTMVSVVVAMLTVYWLMRTNGFISKEYYTYGPIYWPTVLFLLYSMVSGAFMVFGKNNRKQERLMGGMIILIVLLTSIGSNNDVYPSRNNLFLVAPVVFWQTAVFLMKKINKNELIGKLKVISLIPAKMVLVAVLTITFYQCINFGLVFVFAEATGVQQFDNEVENNSVLKGVKMDAQKAEWLQKISDYAAENNLNGKEVILFGRVPSLSFYLEMPSAFNPWSDLESYSVSTMEKDLDTLLQEVENGAEPPVVIKGELPDGDDVKENEIKKWNMIENYMDKLHYTETYNDGKFTVWQVAQ